MIRSENLKSLNIVQVPLFALFVCLNEQLEKNKVVEQCTITIERLQIILAHFLIGEIVSHLQSGGRVVIGGRVLKPSQNLREALSNFISNTAHCILHQYSANLSHYGLHLLKSNMNLGLFCFSGCTCIDLQASLSAQLLSWSKGRTWRERRPQNPEGRCREIH